MKSVSDAERIRQIVISGGLDCLDRGIPHGASHSGQNPHIERRREPRFPVLRDVTVRAWIPPSFEIITGRVRDISRSGVGMVLEATVPPGCEIEFQVGDFQVFAEVRHCRPDTQGGWIVGARVHDVILPDGQHSDHLGE